jgi:hypothetical protein
VVRSFSVKNTGRVSTCKIAYARVLMFPVADTMRVADGARGRQLTAQCASSACPAHYQLILAQPPNG